MKTSSHQVLGAILRASGLVHVARRCDRGKGDILRVLVYHRIVEHGDFHWGNNPNVISARPDDFENQMRYLARHYRPIGAEQLVQTLHEGAPLPPQSVLVTFDDGYRDFLIHAWPILRRHGVPAVLFVPTAFPDSGRHFWWDLVHDTIARTTRSDVVLPAIGAFAIRTSRQRSVAVKQLVSRLTGLHGRQIEEIVGHLRTQLGALSDGPTPVLGWEELRRLVRQGLTVASHTRTHPVLSSLTMEEVVDEIQGAQSDLERELGVAPPLFSYPHGQGDPRALSVLRDQGIVASFTAFTRDPTVNILSQSNPLLLRRDGVNGSGTFSEFCLNLTSLSATIQSSPCVAGWRRRLAQWTTSVDRGMIPGAPTRDTEKTLGA